MVGLTDVRRMPLRRKRSQRGRPARRLPRRVRSNDSRSAAGVTAVDTCRHDRTSHEQRPSRMLGCERRRRRREHAEANLRISGATVARETGVETLPYIATGVTLIRSFAERAQGGWRVREAAPRPSREGDCRFTRSPTAGGGWM